MNAYRHVIAESMPGPSFTYASTTFSLPTQALGRADVVCSEGQVIAAPAGAQGYKSLVGLMSSRDDDGSRKPLLLTYTDGTKASVTVNPAALNNAKAKGAPVQSAYIQSDAQGKTSTALDAVIIPLLPKKTLKSVTLGTGSQLAIWALSLSQATSLPKSTPIFN